MVLQGEALGDVVSWFLTDSIYCSQCLSPSLGEPKQRPTRQPDESVLFIWASVHVHRTACHVTIAKTFRNTPDRFGV